MTHPLEKFRYCPLCGSEDFREHDFKSKRCGKCGFEYYANPAAATAAIIVRTGSDGEPEILVTRRAKDPAKGTLDLPGGFGDIRESAEEGLRREIAEETGLHVKTTRYLFSLPNIYHYSGIDIHTTDLFYEVTTDSRETPRADDDAASVAWMPLKTLESEAFGLASIRQGVAKYQAEVLKKTKSPI